jgi:hypothetical protein
MNTAQYRMPTTYDNISFVGGPAEPVAEYNPSTTTFWKDWQIGMNLFAYTSGANEYSHIYPNTSTRILPTTYFVSGIPGIAKFPIFTQGGVEAGSYDFPALGFRNSGEMYVSPDIRISLMGATIEMGAGYASYFFGFNNRLVMSPVGTSYASYIRCVAK